jgi:hypothetical protein
MINKASLLIILSSNSLLLACAAAPPSSTVVDHDPTLGRSEGVALLVDVCLQRDGIGDRDYFLIGESELGAQMSQQRLRNYLEDSGIVIREQATLVCGARHGGKNSIPAAHGIGEMISDQTQPLLADSHSAMDETYIAALALISSYAFERAASEGDDSDRAISEPMFRQASSVVRDRTGAASVLFMGALGTSRTGALNAVTNIGRFLVGMGTGFATAGLGGNYYYVFVPGRKISGRLLEGALIDLNTGELVWSNAVSVSGNPADPDNWESDQPLDLLFHDLMFQPSGQELLNITNQ